MADQFGGIPVNQTPTPDQFGGTPVAAPSQSGTDYTALAKKFGGTPASSDTQDQTWGNLWILAFTGVFHYGSSRYGHWRCCGSDSDDGGIGFGSSDAYRKQPRRGRADADANRRRIPAHARWPPVRAFSNGNYLDAARHVARMLFSGILGPFNRLSIRSEIGIMVERRGRGSARLFRGLLAYGTSQSRRESRRSESSG